MMHTDCCTWTKIHSTSRSLVVWLRNFMRRRQQRFNSNSVAQWIRRWSTEPEILGLIPSGVAHFLNFLFFTEVIPSTLTEKQRHGVGSIILLQNYFSTSYFTEPVLQFCSLLESPTHSILDPSSKFEGMIYLSFSSNMKRKFWNSTSLQYISTKWCEIYSKTNGWFMHAEW